MQKGKFVQDFDKDTFLGSGYKKLDLKYIFDHLRNLGISAAVLIAATKLTEENILSIYPALPFSPAIIPIVLILISLVLSLLNFSQFLYLASKSGNLYTISICAVLAIPLYFVSLFIMYGYTMM